MPDESLLPFPEAERPTGGKTALNERLEGKQIAWAHVMAEPGPTGSPVLGLEFTDGSRLIVFAALDASSDARYRARLLFRFLEPPSIITKRMERYFRMGRDGQRGQVAPGNGAYERAYVRPEAVPGEFEQRLEGAVIRGVRPIREPTEDGGEQTEIELTGGSRLRLSATAKAAPPFIADLCYELAGGGRIWLP